MKNDQVVSVGLKQHPLPTGPEPTFVG